ncbi:hypothetical protein ACFOWM_10315 [Ferruginibacter yonginensis]|uniref:Uncharacterized protein n=1 Tax=Ferruginibacter yonginensis TaxID=1310416 RepID=A0ABV8QUC1_9BACT
MRITKKKVIVVSVFVVIISNLFPVYDILHLAIDEKHYRYSNGDGSITCTDEIFKSGGSCKLDSNSIKYYKQKYHREPDPIFYRLFWKNPLCFWR